MLRITHSSYVFLAVLRFLAKLGLLHLLLVELQPSATTRNGRTDESAIVAFLLDPIVVVASCLALVHHLGLVLTQATLDSGWLARVGVFGIMELEGCGEHLLKIFLIKLNVLARLRLLHLHVDQRFIDLHPICLYVFDALLILPICLAAFKGRGFARRRMGKSALLAVTGLGARDRRLLVYQLELLLRDV